MGTNLVPIFGGSKTSCTRAWVLSPGCILSEYGHILGRPKNVGVQQAALRAYNGSLRTQGLMGPQGSKFTHKNTSNCTQYIRKELRIKRANIPT
jgi:hypothetical protein